MYNGFLKMVSPFDSLWKNSIFMKTYRKTKPSGILLNLQYWYHKVVPISKLVASGKKYV